MLQKLACEYKGKVIHIVLDNARYQKCTLVASLAKDLGISLHCVPPYSLNLNLIERLWKHVKGGLRSKYYDQFDDFTKVINTIINDTCTGSKELIDHLIGCSVQLYDTSVPINTNSFVDTRTREDKLGMVA